MRLLVEILESVRDAAGPAMAVGMRFNCDELIQGGYETSEAHQAGAFDLLTGDWSTSST